MIKYKYSKELLEEIVRDSLSIMDVMRKLGIRLTGGSHSHLTKRIKSLGIDTSHFLGQAIARGKVLPKLHWQEILLKRNTGRRQHAYILRRALIEYGVEYKCVRCGNSGEWLGEKLTLQVHHKNNDWLDDRPDNLNFICPNCHSIETNLRPNDGN